LKQRSKRSEAPPRWATPRTDRPTRGHRLGPISAVLGQPFHPWQQLVADVALEYDPETGLLAYPLVIVTISRQTGKTTLVFAFELDRCIHCDEWGAPQRVAYSAQTGWDARRKLIDDQAPLLEESPLKGFVKRILRGTGNEAFIFKTGSRIDLISGDKGAGHGRTLDLGVIDEAFDDVDDRREGAMVPAMRNRRNAQRLVTSTAGTDESIYLRRLVRLGRSAVEEGKTEGIAYFEWSVPKEDDPDYDGGAWNDPETWRRYLPALDETAERTMQHALESMSESEFRRAFLNQWTTLETDRVIPAEIWDAVCKRDAAPKAPLKLALDINEDRSLGSLAAVGVGVGELVDTFEGTSRVVERCVEVSKKHKAPIVIDNTGPAISFADEIETQGAKVQRLTGPEVAVACAKFFDAVMDKTITVRESAQMDVAVAAARKKPQGDRFVWKRTKAAADVTPLIALTLAFGAPEQRRQLLMATT
jgi:phage terminase large subunit-like protein